MKKGFSLLEILLVCIIIGVLAVVAFTQYKNMSERGRTVEAKAILERIRSAEFKYYERYDNDFTDNEDLLAVDLRIWNTCSSNDTYFEYEVNMPVAGDFEASAIRCTSGGKPPSGREPYTFTMNSTGVVVCAGPGCP